LNRQGAKHAKNAFQTTVDASAMRWPRNVRFDEPAGWGLRLFFRIVLAPLASSRFKHGHRFAVTGDDCHVGFCFL
jgi:hypothetical protein